MLERNSSANAINVVISILSISQKAFAEGIEFETKFGSFAETRGLYWQRTSLPSLSQKIRGDLSPLYCKPMDQKKKSIKNRLLVHENYRLNYKT